MNQGNGGRATIHGPGFDGDMDARHLSAQGIMGRVMVEFARAGRWTTHREQAEELTRRLGLGPGEAVETAAASARMRELRGEPAKGKGGRAWKIDRRRRVVGQKTQRAYEYRLDMSKGEACGTCRGEGYVGEGPEDPSARTCPKCSGSKRQPIALAPGMPSGSGPGRSAGGQAMLGDWAAPAASRHGDDGGRVI